MAIGYLDQYGLQGGTTALTMVPPAGTAAGQMGIIFVSDKNSSVDPTDPGSGWTRIGSAQVGTGADGVGVGQVRLTAWYKIFSGAESNTAITITGANRSIGGGMVYTKGAGETWGVPTSTFGSDVAAGTPFSALMAANLGLLVGEYLLSVGVYTLDTSFAGRNITIPGVTATVTGISSGRGAVGNQISLWTDHAVSTAGTQSGASTTTGTSGASTTGGALNVRVGLATGTAYTQTPTDAEGLTDSSSFDLTNTVSDSEGLTDSTGLSIARGVAASEALGLSDVATTSLGRASVISDAEGLSDSTSQSLVRGVASTDSQGLTDTSMLSWNRELTFTESFGITDASNVQASGGVSPVDQIGLTDTASMGVSRMAAESESLTDTAALALSTGRSDAEGLTDQATVSSDRAAAIADVASMVDAVFIELTESKELADSLGLTDQVMLSLELAVVDELAMDDVVAGPPTAPQRNITLTGSIEPNRLTGGIEPGRLSGTIEPNRLKGAVLWPDQ